MTMTTLRTTPHELSSTVTLVTPRMAQDWLEFNTSNRNLSKVAVQKFASDIQNNRWVYNGESIKFDREGRLIDGQHRLSAIVLADMPVELLIVRNLEPIAQHTIDVGVSRTAGQIVGMSGIPNGGRLSALAVALIRLERHPNVIWSSTNAPSKTEQVEYVLENADALNTAILEGLKAARIINVPPVAYAVLYMQVRQSSQVDSWDDWHRRLMNGSNLEDGDPRLTLRNQLLRRSSDMKGHWVQQQMIGWCLVGWNAWVEGRQLKIIRFNRDQLPMPTIN